MKKEKYPCDSCEFRKSTTTNRDTSPCYACEERDSIGWKPTKYKGVKRIKCNAEKFILKIK